MAGLVARILHLIGEGSTGGSPIDLLHIEHLPTVGLLLGTIAGVYYLFRKKWLRWGPDVDLLVAEKERQIVERDERLAEAAEDRQKWIDLAFATANTARTGVQTARAATQTLQAIAENGAGPPAGGGGTGK